MSASGCWDYFNSNTMKITITITIKILREIITFIVNFKNLPIPLRNVDTFKDANIN